MSQRFEKKYAKQQSPVVAPVHAHSKLNNQRRDPNKEIGKGHSKKRASEHRKRTNQKLRTKKGIKEKERIKEKKLIKNNKK